MTIGVETVTLPMPAPADEVCSACHKPIEESVAVFSGKGGGMTYHVDCYGTELTPEEHRD